jgi:hypothetical protein
MRLLHLKCRIYLADEVFDISNASFYTSNAEPKWPVSSASATFGGVHKTRFSSDPPF